MREACVAALDQRDRHDHQLQEEDQQRQSDRPVNAITSQPSLVEADAEVMQQLIMFMCAALI